MLNNMFYSACSFCYARLNYIRSILADFSSTLKVHRLSSEITHDAFRPNLILLFCCSVFSYLGVGSFLQSNAISFVTQFHL